jgi:hypothetical protein
MVSKKSKRNIKNRRKTKRKQKGGSLINITRFANKDGVQMFDLIEKQPYSQSPKYGEMVLSDKQFKVVPYYSSFSMTDLLPELNGEENDLIDLITGKPVNGLQSKQKLVYNHSTRDAQLFLLNQFFLDHIDKDDDFTKEMIRVLTKSDLYKKILGLRILVYIYLGKGNIGVPPDTKDINGLINGTQDINTNPIFDSVLRVNAIPQQENGEIYYQKDFNVIKQSFDLDANKTQISTNIYSNGLLIKCYKEITDDDIKSIMSKLPAADLKKYKLVYSEKNKGTYDNIRYLLINTSIISQKLSGKVNTEALITPQVREAARVEDIARRDANARQGAIVAALAAMIHNP